MLGIGKGSYVAYGKICQLPRVYFISSRSVLQRSRPAQMSHRRVTLHYKRTNNGYQKALPKHIASKYTS